MKNQSSQNVWRIFTRILPVIALVVASTAPTASAERPTKRAPAEVAVGGLTSVEQAANKLILRKELEARMPAGALARPVRVELTQKDRDDIAATVERPAPLRIGVVKQIEPRVEVARGKGFAQGVTQQSRDGSFVWSWTVTSPGAQAIRLHFSDFSLPPGAEMYFYGANAQAYGPYTSRGRNGNGDFWTRSLSAETGVVQLRYSARGTKAKSDAISFVISELGHISGRTLAPNAGGIASHDTWPCADNAPCLVDVNCVNTGPAGPAEDAIAKLEWISGQFINTCTGGLLADTDSGSQIPYFLTANHCFSNSNSNMETFFNYTTSSCNGSCPDSLVTGGSPPAADTVGITVVATGSAGDFTLATLNQTPPAGAVFLGWNNSPVAFSGGANLYRVSNANFGPQVYSDSVVNATTGTCSGWPRGERIYSDLNTGSTMGGSSGSPVVNSSGEVVGQLSGCCGFNCGDECDFADNWTVDGALAFYWDSVSEFLDPQGGCTGDPECDDGQFCTGTETCVGGSCQSSGNPCAGGETCNESTDTCDAPACDNDGACEAGEDCNNCPNDCRSKVNGNPNSRYCCDGDLPDCGDSRCSESGWSCGGGGGGCTSDPECDDGEFCNGSETCSGGSCQSGSDPCPGQGCDEGSNQCVSCAGHRDPCSNNGDCCSGDCRRGRCKGN